MDINDYFEATGESERSFADRACIVVRSVRRARVGLGVTLETAAMIRWASKQRPAGEAFVDFEDLLGIGFRERMAEAVEAECERIDAAAKEQRSQVDRA